MEKDLIRDIDYDLKFVELGLSVTTKRIRALTELAEQTLAHACELQIGETVALDEMPSSPVFTV